MLEIKGRRSEIMTKPPKILHLNEILSLQISFVKGRSPSLPSRRAIRPSIIRLEDLEAYIQRCRVKSDYELQAEADALLNAPRRRKAVRV
jgi:hypothetical protein